MSSPKDEEEAGQRTSTVYDIQPDEIEFQSVSEDSLYSISFSMHENATSRRRRSSAVAGMSGQEQEENDDSLCSNSLYIPEELDIPQSRTPLHGHREFRRASLTQISLAPLSELASCKTASSIDYRAHVEEKPIFMTHILNVVMLCMFLMTMSLNDWQFESFTLNPMVGPDLKALSLAGAKYTDKIVEHHEIWRLFTANFLHVGIIHLILNCQAIYMVGSTLEMEYGAFPILLLFLVSGVSGFTLSAIFLPNSLSAGASAGLFGMIAGMLGDIWHNYRFIMDPKEQIFSLALNILVMLAIGLIPFVDNFAHLGGFVAGTLFSMVLFGHDSLYEKYSPRHTRNRKYINVVCSVALVGWMSLLFIMLFLEQGLADDCSWCDDINCVETSLWDCKADAYCLAVFPNGTEVELSLSECL